MSVSLGFSPWLLALCVLLAGGITYWSYRTTTPSVSSGRRALMGGLRFLALTLLFFLLFDPILRMLDDQEEPPVLAVLVDNSASMPLIGSTALDTTDTAPEDALRDALTPLDDESLDGERAFFRFSASARQLDASAPLDSLTFGGARTNISAALEAVQSELRDANLQGIALVSDGQHNAGPNPLRRAERAPVPIHTIVVGDTVQQRDLRVQRVTTNDIGYVDTEQPVEVNIRADGTEGERVTVSLRSDGAELDATEITLPDGDGERTADLQFTPEEEGLQRLVAHVTELEGEVTYENNRRPFSIQVLERKRQILLLGGVPSPDFTATRRLLERDEDTEVDAFVPTPGGTFYQGELPDDFSAFDAVVMAGFPSDNLSSSTLERIAGNIEAEENPLFFVLGPDTDLDALQTHFSDLLPAAPEVVREGSMDAALTPTSQGTRHPIFGDVETADEFWSQLPPLRVNESRWAPSPDARVLATPEVRGTILDDPLLVIRSRAGQRSAAFLGTRAWRWTNLPADLEDAASLWPSVFQNTLEWVATREDDRLVRVEPTEETFGGAEPVTFTGQVYDESLNPVPDATVDVTVTDSDGTEYPHTMEPTGNGRYTLDVGTLPQDTYTYEVEAERNEAQLGTDQGEFAVEELVREFQDTHADAATMRQIAERSGGQFFTADESGALFAYLDQAESFAPQIVTNEREIELWDRYPFLILVVALLTAEWTLRKRSGMV